MGQNSTVIADIKMDLNKKFKIKNLESVNQYFKMQIKCVRVNRIITINQLIYID